MDLEQSSGWIWTTDWQPDDTKVPRLALFRKEVLLTGEIKTASIKMTADSRYKLTINGHFVEAGPLKGNSQKWYLDTIDIQKWLHPGSNVIAVAVLRYPEIHFAGNYSVIRTATPGLYVTGNVRTDFETTELKTDSSWDSLVDRQFKIVSEADDFAPMQIYEETTGNQQLRGWQLPVFDSANWYQSMEYTQAQLPAVLKPNRLYPRTVPFMQRQLQYFKGIKQIVQSSISESRWNELLAGQRPLTLPANQTTIVEITAGVEQTGYLNLALLAGSGATIKLVQAEAYVKPETKLVNGLTIHLKGDREDCQHGYLTGFTDTYQVAGGGSASEPEIYTPFWMRTFRFIRLEITTRQEPLTISQFNFEVAGYPLVVKSRVQTSDRSLSDIWQLSERTLRRCMHETYEDCPYYEQQQYVMDTRAQILYTYAIAADDRLARKAIDDFRCAQNEDGTLNASAPNYEANVIPTFSIYYIWMLYDHMMYFDDLDLLQANLPTVKRILAYFNQHVNESGYLENLGGLNGISKYWSFIDWTTEWNRTSGVPTAVKKGPITIESLLYLYGLQAAIKLTDHLKQWSLMAMYQQQASDLKKAIITHCTGKNGMLQDGPGVDEYSQHAQVFGILTGTLSLAQGRQNLQRTIEQPMQFAQCSVAMSFYLFAALKEVGLYSKSNQYWQIWRNMLAKNATTSVEAEAGERSECHAWGALALYELPTTILGVAPAAPGYKKVAIKPTPGYLKWAKGVVETPRGPVKVAWKVENGQLNLSYDTPIAVELEED